MASVRPACMETEAYAIRYAAFKANLLAEVRRATEVLLKVFRTQNPRSVEHVAAAILCLLSQAAEGMLTTDAPGGPEETRRNLSLLPIWKNRLQLVLDAAE